MLHRDIDMTKEVDMLIFRDKPAHVFSVKLLVKYIYLILYVVGDNSGRRLWATELKCLTCNGILRIAVL